MRELPTTMYQDGMKIGLSRGADPSSKRHHVLLPETEVWGYRQVCQARPDVVVPDLAMPVKNGLDAGQRCDDLS